MTQDPNAWPIATAGPAAQLRWCPLCGAAVPVVALDVHAAWHDDDAAVLPPDPNVVTGPIRRPARTPSADVTVDGSTIIPTVPHPDAHP